MAYTAGNLSLRPGAPGELFYYYDAGSDTMATVAVAGYFNNTDDNLNLAVDDCIFCQCTDGDLWVRVSAISSGSVTVQAMSLDGPWHGVIGSVSASITVPGITELGTGTATAHSLGGAPYIGAKVTITKSGTATGGVTIVTNATTVTIDAAGDRTITMNGKGQSVTLLGVSTTRWVVVANDSTITFS